MNVEEYTARVYTQHSWLIPGYVYGRDEMFMSEGIEEPNKINISIK
jgi:hypothetical protein